MKFQESPWHLDGLRGYLGIADGRILTTHAFRREHGLPHALESTVRIFVEQDNNTSLKLCGVRLFLQNRESEK